MHVFSHNPVTGKSTDVYIVITLAVFTSDKVPGSAAGRAGPSPAGSGGGSEEGGGQAAGCSQGEDGPFCQCDNPGKTAG